MDNTGNYIEYADLLLELSIAGNPKVKKSSITLSSKTIDVSGDIYNFVVAGADPVPLVGDVISQAGFPDCIIEILASPDRLRIVKTGAENPIANGTANLLHSDDIPKATGNKLILEAMELIDRHTGRFFNKRTGVFKVEGNNSHMMHFDVPIIEITKLIINDTSTELLEGEDKDFEAFKGRAQPQDDRWNPKIKINIRTDSIFSGVFTNRVFLKDTRTEITGSFGFLEPDGSTPILVQKATKLIAFDLIAKLGSTKAAGTSAGTLRRVKVDLHEKEFFEDRGINRGFQATGNKEVNNILAIYKRPFLVSGSFKILRDIDNV